MSFIKSKQIESLESSKVSFNGQAANIVAQNVQDAINELNDKIVNAGGGTVTSVNGVGPQQGGNVQLTANDLGAYTTAEVDAELDKKLNIADYNNDKADINNKLDEKVDKVTYNADKNAIEDKLNESVESVTFNDVTREVTVRKNNGNENKFVIPVGQNITEYLKKANYDQLTKTLTITNQADADTTVNMDIFAEKTELDGKVDKTSLTQTGGQAHGDKVAQLRADGKLDITMIPDLAITSVNPTQDSQSALNLANTDAIQVGDVVVLTGDRNKVYMFNGQKGVPFETAFIELSLGDGTVKLVNNCYPNKDGHVEVDIRNIPDLQDELNNRVHKTNDTTIQGGTSNAYKVVKLDHNGIIDETALPPNMRDDYYSIPTFAENELANVGLPYGNGDVVHAQDTGKQYLCVNRLAPVFEDRFVELPSKPLVYTVNTVQPDLAGNVAIDSSHIGYDKALSGLKSDNVKDAIDELNTKIINAGGGTVTKVNGILPNPQGEVELTLANGLQEVQAEFNKYVPLTDVDNTDNHIPRLVDGKLVMEVIPDDIKNKLATINNQAGTGGNINLSIDAAAQDKVSFKVENYEYGSIPYMTDTQKQDIINLFI